MAAYQVIRRFPKIGPIAAKRAKEKANMCDKKQPKTLEEATAFCEGKKLYFYECPHCKAYHLTKCPPERWAEHRNEATK